MAAGSPQSGSLKKTGQKPRAFYDVALGGTFYHFRSILLVAGETCERWKVAGEGVMPEGRVIRVRPRPARLLPGTCFCYRTRGRRHSGVWVGVCRDSWAWDASGSGVLGEGTPCREEMEPVP